MNDSRTLPTTCRCCQQGSRLVQRGFKLSCESCGGFWDVGGAADATPPPAEDYASRRGHFDPEIARMKVRTLDRWLRQAGLEDSILGRQVVCEVGFGGGHGLTSLLPRARGVVGIEVTRAALEHAAALGVPDGSLFHADHRPPLLPLKIDLWLFQDSFEHLPAPGEFLEWMVENSAPQALALLVLPRADSWSARLMGRKWVHRVPDHPFHWSRAGLEHRFAQHGWRVERRFYPLKWISPVTVIYHLAVMNHREPRPGTLLVNSLKRLAFPFNFGEMGVLFRLGQPS